MQAPFKVAQEVEDTKYVHLSLLPKIIQKLGKTLHDYPAAVYNDDQAQFYNMLFHMNHDLETRIAEQ